MNTAILGISLLVSVITDLHSRKILNVITLPVMLIGLIESLILHGIHGLYSSLFGLALGIACLSIPYVLGQMGAGDVKLLMAVGALEGPHFVWLSFVYTCITGGVMAAIVLTIRRQWLSTLQRLWLFGIFKKVDFLEKQEYHAYLPYGLAIAIGTCVTWVLEIAK